MYFTEQDSENAIKYLGLFYQKIKDSAFVSDEFKRAFDFWREATLEVSGKSNEYRIEREELCKLRRWHDLKKDPNDLPPEGHFVVVSLESDVPQVLVAAFSRIGNVQYWYTGNDYSVGKRVIAWKYYQ